MPVSGNVAKQDQLPSYNGRQCNDEKGKEEFAAKFPPEDAQHSGLGAKLLHAAEDRARAIGYDRLVVISAIGTRRYYLKHGFERGELYLIKSLKGGKS